MKEPNDEDLILYHYGEAPEAEEIRQALEASPQLRARYEELSRTLELVGPALEAPERPADYGARVWERIEGRLETSTLASTPLPSTPLKASRERVEGLPPVRDTQDRREGTQATNPFPERSRRERQRPAAFPERSRSQRRTRFLTLAAAAVLLLAAGFFLGRHWPRVAGPQIASAPSGPLPVAARERILARAVADHLERSERLFTELANARAEGPVDVAAERRWAHDLLAANRLYRQSTAQGGRPRLASLLDELEPFLIELSHGPDEIPAAELDEFRRRFEGRALLFKMRVVGARLHEPQSL